MNPRPFRDPKQERVAKTRRVQRQLRVSRWALGRSRAPLYHFLTVVSFPLSILIVCSLATGTASIDSLQLHHGEPAVPSSRMGARPTNLAIHSPPLHRKTVHLASVLALPREAMIERDSPLHLVQTRTWLAPLALRWPLLPRVAHHHLCLRLLYHPHHHRVHSPILMTTKTSKTTKINSSSNVEVPS